MNLTTQGSRALNNGKRHGSDTDADRPVSADADAAHEETSQRDTPRASPETGEAGGPGGLEPTRYGDWERNGRCIDF